MPQWASNSRHVMVQRACSLRLGRARTRHNGFCHRSVLPLRDMAAPPSSASESLTLAPGPSPGLHSDLSRAQADHLNGIHRHSRRRGVYTPLAKSAPVSAPQNETTRRPWPTPPHASVNPGHLHMRRPIALARARARACCCPARAAASAHPCCHFRPHSSPTIQVGA
jgi:hypothetical protein